MAFTLPEPSSNYVKITKLKFHLLQKDEKEKKELDFSFELSKRKEGVVSAPSFKVVMMFSLKACDSDFRSQFM